MKKPHLIILIVAVVLILLFSVVVFSGFGNKISGMFAGDGRCVETGDAGDDAFVYGTIAYRASPWSLKNKYFVDRCSYGGQKLVEVFCNERGGITHKTYDKNNGCELGCVDGVCVLN